ncbi:peptidase S41 [Skermanella stibiiresistens SB22]|uniref:Peptidase S41 n=1 Tax=Skermanella stibiiresistens SB22 TaxID=1385369 RepID=W9H9W8_9PROT|nr:S41 family peptidase [Skermanella stibiiresistens]EWY42739.1 peptidase S41 [Skermanella stibiiresistens SB22]
MSRTRVALGASLLLFTPLQAWGQAAVEANSVSDEETSQAKALELFKTAFTQLRGGFVDQVDAEKLVESAINGLLTSLDPHSKYLNAERYTENKAQNNGEFGGVGVEMAVENGLVKVLAPIEDSPAFRAGVLAGDLFTHINGEPVRGVTLAEAMDRMRGGIGTPLSLTIQRGPEGKTFDLTLVRELVKSPAVRWRREGDVGYIKISGFTQQTQPGLEKALMALDAELGPRLTGYVLDLRDNPGGLVKQAISVCDTFLDQGEIVSTRGRSTPSERHYWATPGDLARGKPIVMIVNGRSASASEIVAGALQDQRRAVILGSQTFGKGSVQTITPLSNRGATRMTTARYYTPSGRSIQALGITPDVLVDAARVTPVQSSATGGADQANPAKPVDYQLTRALDILRGAALFAQPPASASQQAQLLIP